MEGRGNGGGNELEWDHIKEKRKKKRVMERGVWGTDGYKVQNQIMQNFSHRDRFWSSNSSALCVCAIWFWQRH